ncbi:DUF6516 family protein [Clostridium sp.]|uniref:toxin-antitoxin system TumE family protein n=1 Tax=Clostridium sp. TaxID=1506 RepID=UPI002634E26B|nr:DUF6516 family protein [Clostridium sp.]
MIKQKLTLRKSRFDILENEFDEIISETLDIDQTGKPSIQGLVTRKKIVFKDNSFLSVTEWYTKDGYISYYNYDWYKNKNEIIKKFHSEPHKEKAKQTKTEPFHMHRHDLLGQEVREPNYDLQELYDILDYIESQIIQKIK